MGICGGYRVASLNGRTDGCLTIFRHERGGLRSQLRGPRDLPPERL